MNKPKILFLDIETSPCIGVFFNTGNQYVSEEQIIEHTQVICICTRDEKNETRTFSWDNLAKPFGLVSLEYSDKLMLQDFVDYAKDFELLVGHNGKAFDVKVLVGRMCYHKIPPLPIIPIEDTFRQVLGSMRLPSYKLSYLCRYFGLGYKIQTGGIKLWIDVMGGNEKSLAYMIKYCAYDTLLMKRLWERIKPYVKSSFNMAVFDNRPCCPSCAGKLIKDGFTLTTAGKKQRYQCTKCGKYCTDGKNLVSKSSEFPR